ncbi:MAG: hypothetical protein IKV76_01630 [Clostridia bacterium]|nr:hypothetical protein [Clostridia bacterium]
MTNLMEEIDNGLAKLGLPPISNVVDNKKKSIQYIKTILKQYGNKVTIPFNSVLDQYDFRVKHVLFSFGLGIVLSSFHNLKNKIEEEYKKYEIQQSFIYTWITLCLYHDFDYFIAASHFNIDDIEKIKLNYNIFNYTYCDSRYSKELYCHYYKNKYKQQNWNQNNYNLSKNEEVGDHGILGGYVLFERLYSSETEKDSKNKKIVLPTNDIELHFERIPLYQDICFRIMEHNIWKNNNLYEDSNPLQEIDAEHFLKIGCLEPLLYLLSLVDTIEMTKKFCRYSDESKDKEHYVFPKTLGIIIKIKVSAETIDIDYSELELFIKKHKYFDSINGWKASVMGLNNWVCVDACECKKSRLVLKTENNTIK